MGEAKRKRDAQEKAYAEGLIWKPVPQCPACQSRAVHRVNPQDRGIDPDVGRLLGSCDYELCLDCEAIWEPKRVASPDSPDVKVHDTSKMRVCSGYLRMIWSRDGLMRKPDVVAT